jgi:serine protease Do
MNCFMRPYIQVGVVLLGAVVTFAPRAAQGQLSRISQIVDEPSPLLHSSSPGYLGVLVTDVDTDSVTKLRLKDAKGAVITLIDHDAPAAQIGLRVNDVLLEVNGQPVESAEAFGRMMREIPPGRKISLLISRDGSTQTLAVELADRKKLDTDIWNKLNNGSDISSPVQGMGILGTGSGGDVPLSGGFHMPFTGSGSLKVGALVEPLTAQMAEYLGVPNGLMVKQVARKSQAAAAGIKAFDVILKVGTDSIATVSDWERAMRTNQGKSVAVTILRDKKQQTLTLLVDSKKKGEVEFDGLLPDGPCPLMAFADSNLMREMQQGMPIDQAQMDSMRDQAEALQKQMKQWQNQSEHFGITPDQSEEFRRWAEQFSDAFKNPQFGDDPKKPSLKHRMPQFGKNFITPDEFEQFKQQMDRWQESFDPKQFGFDKKQMEELQKELEKMRKMIVPGFDEQQRKQMQKEMDQLNRQMEEMQALGSDHLV